MILIVEPRLQIKFKKTKPNHSFFGEHTNGISRYDLPFMSVWTTRTSRFAEFVRAYVDNPSLEWVQSVRMARKKQLSKDRWYRKQSEQRWRDYYRERLDNYCDENKQLREKVRTLTETIKGLDIIKNESP